MSYSHYIEYYNKIFEVENVSHANHDHQIPNNLCYSEKKPIDDKYSYCYYDQIPYQDPICIMRFHTINTVSNIPGLALNIDPNLTNPWGILLIGDILWVANSGNGLLTTYNLTGLIMPRMVNVFGPYGNIAQPTGLVYNANPNAFTIVKSSNTIIRSKCNKFQTSDPNTIHSGDFPKHTSHQDIIPRRTCPANYIRGSANIIIATRDGTINGYNASIDPNNSIIMFDNSKNNSVYTGIAIINNIHYIDNRIKHKDILYVTDFYNRKIDVFCSNCNPIGHLFPFIDEYSGDPIPGDFAPYNIICLNDMLYVTYAKQDPYNNQYPLSGIGYGYVSIFSLNGTFIKRLISRDNLNIPWGLAFVPSVYGYPAGSIMVGNFGNGSLNIYDNNGKYLGNLKDEFNNDLCIVGIRGLINNPQYEKIMYWTASNNYYHNALIGNIYTKFCQ